MKFLKVGCLSLIGLFILIFAFGFFFGDTSKQVLKSDKVLGATPNDKLAKEIGISSDEASSILDALKLTGLEDYKKIEHDDLLDNAHFEGEKGFRIEKENVSNVILYLNSDSSVYQLKFADHILYENGTTLAVIDDFILSNQQKSDIQFQSQEALKKVLKSPSTAKFPNILEWSIEKVNGEIIVNSYVDSENGFGAMIRSEFQLKVKDNTIYSLVINGKEYLKQ